MTQLVRIPDGEGEIMMAALTYGVKVMECKYKCGGHFVVTTRTQIPPHHLQCAIQAATDCVIQMRNKSGQYYEKWQARMVASLRHIEAGVMQGAITQR